MHKLSITYFLLPILLGACGMIGQRLENIGKLPPITPMQVHEQGAARSTAAPIQKISRQNSDNVRTANSLWNSNNRYFLRNWQVGDIVSVVIKISDQARFNNKTQRSRQDADSLSIPNMFGLENVVKDVATPSSLIKLKANGNSVGNGKIDRQEIINTVIAATVVGVLPSGNLVLKGSQEVRVNFELRDITVQGIASPKDISSDNTVKVERLAEARVSYGGRGQIFDIQQPPYGQQILEAISPF